MVAMSTNGQCGATTAKGSPCRGRSVADTGYCRRHQPPAEEAAEPRSTGSTRGERSLREEVEDLLKRAVDRLPIGRLFPALSPGRVVETFRAGIEKVAPKAREELLRSARNFLIRQATWLATDTWKGAWTFLSGVADQYRGMLQRRARGDYEVDAYGMDEEFTDWIRPAFRFLYRFYWRVDTTGVQNVPGQGRGLIVANHSGVLPWDGAMIMTGIWEEHAEPRYVRTLYLDWFTQIPWVSQMLTRTGQILAHPENGERLLNEDRLVAVFPEGLKGVGKLFRDRYKLARFGRGGFARMAIRTGAPIIPTAVVGAEEIHPTFRRLHLVEKAFNMPIVPLTPTFPWLGVFGFIPLPSKWKIHFCDPVPTNRYRPEDADNFLVVSKVANQVRDSIQKKIHELLKERKGVFW